MTTRLSLTIRGRRKLWSFTILEDAAHLAEWREDGLQVEELVASVPVSDAEFERLSKWCSDGVKQ